MFGSIEGSIRMMKGIKFTKVTNKAIVTPVGLTAPGRASNLQCYIARISHSALIQRALMISVDGFAKYSRR